MSFWAWMAHVPFRFNQRFRFSVWGDQWLAVVPPLFPLKLMKFPCESFSLSGWDLVWLDQSIGKRPDCLWQCAECGCDNPGFQLRQLALQCKTSRRTYSNKPRPSLSTAPGRVRPVRPRQGPIHAALLLVVRRETQTRNYRGYTFAFLSRWLRACARRPGSQVSH